MEELAHGEAFAGISGFGKGFKAAGIKTLWHIEIDQQCQNVLRRHYPGSLLFPDIRECGAHNLPYVDIFSMGFPCQGLSVAGLRQGLADDRSNLFFEGLRIIKEIRPKWVVIENVPGLLSSGKGEDILTVMNSLEEAGYIVDIDILDAQFFGVAQRRRRVFIICQSVESLLDQKTTLSAQTIAQCLIEILGSILVEARRQSVVGYESSTSESKFSKGGLMRRMKLFKMAEEGPLRMLLENLEEETLRFQREHELWGLVPGAREVNNICRITTGDRLGSISDATVEACEEWNTAPLWKSTLEEVCQVAKLFTTSTETYEITELRIYTCAKIVLNIGAFITLSSNSCPTYLNAASSTLIVIEEYMNYARQASSTFFAGLEWIQPWLDFLGQAKRVRDALISAGINRKGQVLLERESVPGDTAPSRKEGSRVTGTIADSSGKRGWSSSVDAQMWVETSASLTAGAHPGGHNGQDDHKDGRLIPVAHSTRPKSGMEQGWNSNFVVDARNGTTNNDVTHTLQAKKSGYSLNALPLVANAFNGYIGGCDDNDAQASHIVIGTLHNGSIGRDASDAADGKVISFAWQRGVSENDRSYPVRNGEYAGSISSIRVDAVAGGFGVRRLTPTEWERLQGFPDGHTAYGVDDNGNRVEISDSARYRMLGNAVCLKVAEWLGKRIKAVEVRA